jgi:spermidine/putrescine transport system permease protein
MAQTATMAAPAAGSARAVPRRDKPLPLEYLRKRWLQAVLGFGFFFLYFPIMALIVTSFNVDKRNITWKGFTFDWYVKAYNNASLFDALMNSLIVACIATAVSTLIGTMLGLALYRYRFSGKASFESTAFLPIVIPEICMGVALAAFFAIGTTVGLSWLNVQLSLVTVTISHISFCFPFVAVVVRSRMIGFDESLEEASRDLGASAWQTFWSVTVPYMMPGIVAGALLAFTLSLDDFVITYFTSGPGSTTLPIKIYSMVRFSVTPDVNAASTVLIIITLTVAMGAMAIQARSAKRTVKKNA